MSNGEGEEPVQYFTDLLLSLGWLRTLTGPSWRDLERQSGVASSTVQDWLKQGSVPDEVDGLKKVAALIVDAARQDHRASPEAVARVAHVNWSAAHSAAQTARAGLRGEQAASRRSQRVSTARTARERIAGLPDRPLPVAGWDARQLNVHAAASPADGSAASAAFVLPVYVRRPHDEDVRRRLMSIANGSRAEMLVLRGGSCTGKTRTAYEAVQRHLPDWHLIYPKTADALIAAVEANAALEKTVLWLDDAQHLFEQPAGDDAAAALRRLLERPGPVIVFATMSSSAHRRLTTPAKQDELDIHPNVRALLRPWPAIDVPEEFTGESLNEVYRKAEEDSALNAVLVSVAYRGALTQTLAAGPDLLDHWLHAACPYGKAVLTAAIDASRLGVSKPTTAFLLAAAPGYLRAHQRAEVPQGWSQRALDYAYELKKGVARALNPVPLAEGMGAEPDVHALADYLEEHAAPLREGLAPPPSFWTAIARQAGTPDELWRIGREAGRIGFDSQAEQLFASAVEASGHAEALWGLARYRELAGDHQAAERLAVESERAGNSYAFRRLMKMRPWPADAELAIKADLAGYPHALSRLTWELEYTDSWDALIEVWQRAAKAGKDVPDWVPKEP
ncbi:hypothetical protein JCM4914_27240 [Streptomyces platensis subsp. malvinus]